MPSLLDGRVPTTTTREDEIEAEAQASPLVRPFDRAHIVAEFQVQDANATPLRTVSASAWQSFGELGRRLVLAARALGYAYTGSSDRYWTEAAQRPTGLDDSAAHTSRGHLRFL